MFLSIGKIAEGKVETFSAFLNIFAKNAAATCWHFSSFSVQNNQSLIALFLMSYWKVYAFTGIANSSIKLFTKIQIAVAKAISKNSILLLYPINLNIYEKG